MFGLTKKTNKSNQRQESGDNSTNVQIINNGIPYSDLKEIFLDLFEANILKFKAEAAAIAAERASEITEKFILQLAERNSEAIKELQQPAMQDALFTVQKQYAKTNNKELGDLLVDILVDRVEQTNRTMLQIALDEALNIASKLTIAQLDTLTIFLVITQVFDHKILDLDSLIKEINQLKPFIGNFLTEGKEHLHIQCLGCIVRHPTGFSPNSLASTFLHHYGKLFSVSSDNEIKTKLIQRTVLTEEVFAKWNDALELTSVGIVIAHANYRRKTGETLDLSMWFK